MSAWSGLACSGRSSVTTSGRTLRARHSSISTLRKVVNSQARGEPRRTSSASGCFQARSSVSCTASSDRPASPPVSRIA